MKKNEHLQLFVLNLPSKIRLSVFHIVQHWRTIGSVFWLQRFHRQSQPFLIRIGYMLVSWWNGAKGQRAFLIMFEMEQRVFFGDGFGGTRIDVPEIGFGCTIIFPIMSMSLFIGMDGLHDAQGEQSMFFIGNQKNFPILSEELQQGELSESLLPVHQNGKRYCLRWKKHKISKGDIVGLFIKQGKIQSEELGLIEIKQECAFVAVHKDVAASRAYPQQLPCKRKK